MSRDARQKIWGPNNNKNHHNKSRLNNVRALFAFSKKHARARDFAVAFPSANRLLCGGMCQANAYCAGAYIVPQVVMMYVVYVVYVVHIYILTIYFEFQVRRLGGARECLPIIANTSFSYA